MITGFKNYSVSKDGKTVTNLKSGKEVRQVKSVTGYFTVSVKSDGGKWLTAGVHRLVVSQHTGIDLKDLEAVNHINGKRDDNRIENLEACTTLENSSLPRFSSKVRDLPKGIHHWRLGKKKFRVVFTYLAVYITAYFLTLEEATAFYVEKYKEHFGVNPYEATAHSVVSLRN